MFTKMKSYSLEAITALLCLAVLYSAARYEVMDVLSSSSRNDVVASPQARWTDVCVRLGHRIRVIKSKLLS